jgi:hypothetical protein
LGCCRIWQVPAGKENDMNDALEQIVDLLHAPARKPIEIKDFGKCITSKNGLQYSLTSMES